MVFAVSRDGSCLFSALGHTVTHNTVGRPYTERSSAQVTTLSMSAKCCSPWRGQKVGGSPLRLAWSVVLCQRSPVETSALRRMACLVGGALLQQPSFCRHRKATLRQACPVSSGHTHTPSLIA